MSVNLPALPSPERTAQAEPAKPVSLSLTVLRILAGVALLFTLGNALWASWDQDITYDELYHLEWPRRLLQQRVDERDSQSRFDSKTPALLPSVLLMWSIESYGVGSQALLRFASRLTPVLYLMCCFALVGTIGGSINPSVGWLAVLLLALDPNMAANASIATSDVAYALAVLLVGWTMVRAARSWICDLAIGAAVGIAFATKFTAVLLLITALGYVLWRAGKSPKKALIGLLTFALGACVASSAAYLLVNVGVPIGDLGFKTRAWQGIAELFPSVRPPFPTSILTGIDRSMDRDQHVGWNVYLLGRLHPDGVWYYFFATWLMKTPVALGAAILVGLSRLRSETCDRWTIILATLFGVHLAYFSFAFSTQLGFRYALLCIPLASLLAARGLGSLPIRHAGPFLVFAATLSLAERLPYWGDPIAFTSIAVWPKSRAYWYTADSSLDYGQNRERVYRYIRESGLSAVSDQATITPGLYVIDVNNLTKVGNFKSHRWLIDNDIPAVNFGFTHFGFSITSERFEKYMDETRTLSPSANFEGVCGGSLPHYSPGSQIPFRQTEHPDEGRLWIVCARSARGADIGLRTERGRLLFGSVISPASCFVDLLREGQQSWWRIPPGAGVQLCIREIRYARAYLPYLLDSYLTIRGRGADVEIRSAAVNQLTTPYGSEQEAR